jgi:hypothetical protein
LIYATCATLVKCTLAADTVYIINKENKEIGRQLIRCFKKRKSLDEIQPAISTAKRFCRFGAGHEEHVGVVDTPGFECDPNPSINPEGHGLQNILYFGVQGIPEDWSRHRCS